MTNADPTSSTPRVMSQEIQPYQEIEPYPHSKPELPPRSRGVIALFEENCTVCMLCARECPDWCIYIEGHKEEVVVPGAARPRQRNVLDLFPIDCPLCMY